MINFCKLAGGQILLLGVSIFLAAFLATALVRLAPGFGLDETALNERASAGSQPPAANVLELFTDSIRAVFQGDFGDSRTFGRPARELIAERLPTTLTSVIMGVCFGWTCALVPAFLGNFRFLRWLRTGANGVSAALLSVPAALIAFAAVASGASAALGISAVVFPKVYRYTDNLVQAGYRQGWVFSARARGIDESSVLVRHVFRGIAPELVVLVGVTINLALGAAIPMEVLCDQPGLGQLAWRAALGRDLPVVVAVTALIAACTMTANSAAELISGLLLRRQA